MLLQCRSSRPRVKVWVQTSKRKLKAVGSKDLGNTMRVVQDLAGARRTSFDLSEILANPGHLEFCKVQVRNKAQNSGYAEMTINNHSY